jgi:hypothetical protein
MKKIMKKNNEKMKNNEKLIKRIMKIIYPLKVIIFHYSKKIMTIP